MKRKAPTASNPALLRSIKDVMKRKAPIADDPALLRNREAFARITKEAKTQAEAALKIGVSQAAFSKWASRGWCSPKRAKQLEELFGVPRRNLIHPQLRDEVFH